MKINVLGHFTSTSLELLHIGKNGIPFSGKMPSKYFPQTNTLILNIIVYIKIYSLGTGMLGKLYFIFIAVNRSFKHLNTEYRNHFLKLI